MTEPSLASVLHHIRCLAETEDQRQQSDQQLLELFQHHHDDAAFAVLIRRHGRLVLSALRRVLSEEADVEDAFQATFLVLLRKASSVRWQASMGSWLFGVAHRIALKARANALRRQSRESKASKARPRAQEEAADLTWREALGLLHEELDRLPDTYLLPLLLCYLDGKTREDAALTLSCSVNAIKWRLERGRILLRNRLIRRGVTLSGALLAAAVDAPTARSVAPVLVRATLNAAKTGAYRTSVAALMKAAAPALGIGKIRLAVGALLAVSLLAVNGSLALAPPGGAPQPSAAEQVESRQPPPDTAPAKGDNSAILCGRVLDPDGKPVKSARLYVSGVRKDPPTLATDYTFVQKGISDTEGRFRIELSRADLRPLGRSSLLAAADGYGVDWTDIPPDNAQPELTLRLVKDQPIRGRILNTEGKPLAGVRVRVIGLMTGANGRLDAFLSSWQADWYWAAVQTPKSLSHLEQTLSPVVTDRDGRFRITGTGVERVALLKIQGSGIATTSLRVIAQPGFNPATLKAGGRGRVGSLLGPTPLFGPTFEYVAAPERIIEGTVREAGSGKPVPGFTIYATLGDETEYAVLDKIGRYRLAGIARKKDFHLIARPPENSSWLEASALVRDGESVRPLNIDFTVARGVVVTGRILDKTTGKGVPGYVHAGISSTNKSSDREGRFRLVVVPGPCVLLAGASSMERTSGGQWVNPYKKAELDTADSKHVKIIRDGGGHRYVTSEKVGLVGIDDWNAVKYLDLAPDATGATCDLFVDRGKTLTVKIEDDRGKPLTGTTIAGVTDFYYPVLLRVPETQVMIHGLDPKRPGWLPFLYEKRQLVFLHTDRQLGGVLYVSGDEKQPLIARLSPTGTMIGRILNSDGQPRADVNIKIIYSDGKSALVDLEHAKPFRTDKEGRFRVEGVVPALGFTTMLSSGRTELVVSEPRFRTWLQVKPGEKLDLGDVCVKPAP
jgi:RNA polymerase sigma factor (sigma-70 family)